MTLNTKMTTWGLLATLAAASVSPALADGYRDRNTQQNQKNTMRNLGIAGAAVAALGVLNHNNTLALLGAAGAGLAGSQYEKDRQQQSQDNNRYYYRGGRNNGNRNWNNGSAYNRRQYRNQNWNNNDQNWNNNDQGRGQDWNNNQYRDNNQYRNQGWNSGSRDRDDDRDSGR